MNDPLLIIELDPQPDRVSLVDELEGVGVDHDPRHALGLTARREVVEWVPCRATGDGCVGKRRVQDPIRQGRNTPDAEDAPILSGRIHGLSLIGHPL